MAAVRMVDARGLPPERILGELRRRYSIGEYVERVRPIVEDVARRGYRAVAEYSEKFDGVSYEDPRIPEDEMEEALREVGDEVAWALRTAAERIEEYQRSIMPPQRPGLAWRPVERVGVYVPGGRKPYPSSLLMTAIPAIVAGAGLVAAVTPPSREPGFKASPLVEAAALTAGVDALYAVGGAQAVAGLAYAAHPLPGVDMIAGPGSPYVEAAKLLVSSRVGIDMLAGPSEIFIVADETANPLHAALDLLAQAEHGPLSSSILATNSRGLASAVASRAEEWWREGMGAVYIVVVESIEKAVDLANTYAPEHLELLVEEPGRILPLIRSAGAISLGEPVAFSDYAAGPSHVLPTGGAARWRGGLSVYDFLKPVAIVEGGREELLDAAVVLARAEGFEFHAKSLEARRP